MKFNILNASFVNRQLKVLTLTLKVKIQRQHTMIQHSLFWAAISKKTLFLFFHPMESFFLSLLEVIENATVELFWDWIQNFWEKWFLNRMYCFWCRTWLVVNLARNFLYENYMLSLFVLEVWLYTFLTQEDWCNCFFLTRGGVNLIKLSGTY